MRRPLLAILVAMAAGLAHQPAKAETPAGEQHPSPPPAPWWRLVPDDGFQSIVEQAGAVASVETAQARLRQAKALAQAARGLERPLVGVGLDQSLAGAQQGVGGASSTLRLTLDAPLDLNGALRARRQAAVARAGRATAEVDVARLQTRLTAARLYVALRSAQGQLAALDEAVVAAEQDVAIAEARAAAGLSDALAVAQARSALATQTTLRPLLIEAEAAARSALEALLGMAPGELSLPSSGSPSFAQPIPKADVQGRPDLRARVSELEALRAEAAAAQADRRPTVSLAAIGETLDASDGLFVMSPAGGAARLTGALTAPLWDGGRRAAVAEAAEALAEAEEIALTQALLEADAQAEQARLRIAELRTALDGRRAVVAAAEDEAALARARYRSGLGGFTEVTLAAQRRAAARQEEVRAEAALAEAHLDLIAAQGEGRGPG